MTEFNMSTKLLTNYRQQKGSTVSHPLLIKLVDHILEVYCQKYPVNAKAFQQIQNIIANHRTNPTYIYQILYGLVQSGKSPLIHLVIWYLQMRYGYRCALVTIKLDCVRQDIIDKLTDPNNHLNALIKQIAPEHYHDISLKVSIFKSPHSGARNQLIIFLMQPDNYRYLVKFIKSMYTHEHPVCIVIDEIHEMYTNTAKMLATNEIPKADKLHNRSIIHYLIQEVRQTRLLLLGVTATPVNALADIYHHSNLPVISLDLQPPINSLIYYGLGKFDSQLCRSIDVRAYDTIKNAIDNMLQDSLPLVADKYEIRCLLIASELYNVNQEHLAQQIKQWYPNKSIVVILNQQRSTENNCHVNNIKQLFHYWQQHITDEIARHGFVCVIAKNCVRAGITFKGTCKIKDHHVVGLTHMIIKPSKTSSIESQLQFMRLQGWYPQGHRSVLYCPTSELSNYQSHLFLPIQQAVQRFNGRPKSIACLDNSTTMSICSNKLYRKANRVTYTYTISSHPPTSGTALETTIYRVPLKLS